MEVLWLESVESLARLPTDARDEDEKGRFPQP
jgi:hypothetical protein